MISQFGPQVGLDIYTDAVDSVDIAISTASTADDCPYDISITKGATKLLTFTVTSDGTTAIDLTSATLMFQLENVKRGKFVDILDTDFDKTNESTGIVTLLLDTSGNDYLLGTYTGILEIDFGATQDYSNSTYIRIT